MSQQEKIILFGGSFDPIHRGHLEVAAHALHTLGAGRLIFIPARRSPHKRRIAAEGSHRLAMIRLAIEGTNRLDVSDCELRRPEPSYTIDAVGFFRQQAGPQATLYWLMGADQLEEFGKWHQVGRLLDLCRICVMLRGGYPLPNIRRFAGIFTDEQIGRLENDLIRTPEIHISSTDIRRQLACGHMPADALHPAVADYIKQHRLYGYKPSE
ncbi:MAG: nicotinate (nicotinamide) nucleotide adenylyltransferase [Phycisphaerae bacterium]|nr:nicotinate (nicotinamide) nucleotide adenylyltransferase [Phycisphaerae bacterium]